MDIELPDDFKEFLKLLNAQEVDYLLIGRHKDLNDLENLP